MAPNLTRSSTFADFAVPATTSTSINFYLAASINAENDCLLVPSMDALSTHSKRPLAVHWLNNKELTFNQEVERILTDALLHETPDASTKSDLHKEDGTHDDVSTHNGVSVTPPSPIPPELVANESPSATMKLSSHGSIQVWFRVDVHFDLPFLVSRIPYHNIVSSYGLASIPSSPILIPREHVL